MPLNQTAVSKWKVIETGRWLQIQKKKKKVWELSHFHISLVNPYANCADPVALLNLLRYLCVYGADWYEEGGDAEQQ